MKRSQRLPDLLRVAWGIWIVAVAAPAAAFEQEVTDVATQIRESLGSSDRTMAVVDFVDVSGERTELGRFLAEEMSVALLEVGFKIIDRAHLARIMEESRLGQSGIVDPETAKELGKIIGADALVTGTLTTLGEGLRMTVKILDTDTATLVAGARTTISLNDELRRTAMRGLAESIGASSRSGGYTKSYEVETKDFNDFSVTLLAVRLMANGDLAVMLRLENKLGIELAVGMPDWNARSWGDAVDDGGNSFRLDRGLQLVNCDPPRGGTRLGPNETQEMMLVFNPEGGSKSTAKSRIFNIGLRLAVCKVESGTGRMVTVAFNDAAADPLPDE